jgi:DNA-binding transcriptional LysR family regulator
MTASSPGPLDAHAKTTELSSASTVAGQVTRLAINRTVENSNKTRPLTQIPRNGSTSPAPCATANTRDNPSQRIPNLHLVDAAPMAGDPATLKGRSYNYFTPAKLEAFVAVAEEGGFSAAARRLHISQPALSHTLNALERQFGVELLVRSSTGVQTTQAGRALLDEARAVLARHGQLLRAMAGYAADGGGVIRLGIPLELAPEVLRALAKFAADHPETRVEPRHVCMAAQLGALRSGHLDMSLMRERPTGPDFDTMLVARENLGVLLAEELAARLAGPNGIRLDALAGLDWVGFPRSNSPAWYDDLAAILRTHGIDAGSADSGDHFPIPSVTFTAVSAGYAFALAPPLWAHPIPETVVWSPLTGHPVVRRTWAVWPARSRRRDVAQLITALEQPDTP